MYVLHCIHVRIQMVSRRPKKSDLSKPLASANSSVLRMILVFESATQRNETTGNDDVTLAAFRPPASYYMPGGGGTEL